MSELVRASVSIESDLMARFDQFVESSGHHNRSEAIRDLIRSRLMEEQIDVSGDTVASVTLLYNHAKRRLSWQIEEHGHVHHDVVLSSMHIHVTADLCLEVVALRGPADDVKHVANHLIGLPGVLHGKAVYSGTALMEGHND